MVLLWQIFTSLRLTVALLALSVLLVFFGTLAQVDQGLWKAQKIWFESYLITWQYLQLFGLRFVVPIFPGGYTLGFILLAGLMATFLKRFAWRREKVGVILTHGGVILLLLGQLLTQQLAVESEIELKEGETKAYSEDPRRNELAISWDAGDQEDTFVIPESMLKPGTDIEHDRLPFIIRVKNYAVNCEIRPARPELVGPAVTTPGSDTQWSAQPRAEVTDGESRNVPFAEVELLQNGHSLGARLVTPWLAMLGASPQEFVTGQERFRTELRSKRYYTPFSVKLLKTSHETYRGTDIPKNFRSRVRIIDPTGHEARDVDIYMNHPLRSSGFTLYQARMGRDPEDLSRGTSVLQVVRNPTWLTPYAAVFIVAAGMYIQFRQHLATFLAKRLSRDAMPRARRWPRIAVTLLEAGVLGSLVIVFTLKLTGYAL